MTTEDHNPQETHVAQEIPVEIENHAETNSQNTVSHQTLGVSGSVAKQFLTTEITPLLALVGFLLGVFAVFVTPREEEPQINVTFANVFINFPGASATEVEQIVSTPSEQKFSEIEGIEHVYSTSKPGMAILTIAFKVGEDRTAAILRLYNVVFSNQDWLPANLGISQPLVKPKGIDDVPIVTLTLWSDKAQSTYQLQEIAHTIEAELKRVKGTRDIYTVGGVDRVVRVTLNPSRLAGYNIALEDLRYALATSNVSQKAGYLVKDNQTTLVQAGTFLSNEKEISDLVVGLYQGNPVYLRDVADVSLGAGEIKKYVWFGTGPQMSTKGIKVQGEFPAVTIAVAKQPGTNAVQIAEQVIERFEQIRGVFVPDDIQVTVTRDYGATADAKAKKLIGKLAFATAFVVLLVLLALGWREAIIVGIAVVVTLVITLFASWAWGFTLNRVSLFALIFSIGILVDDAIVVVENIHRHMQLGAKSLLTAIPVAVDEVGGPTILATLTVIAALLPMAFVSGLMGPYMSPIPINASFGMIISLVVAFVFTPWLTYKVLRKVMEKHAHDGHGEHATPLEKTFSYRFFNLFMRPFLRIRLLRWILLIVVLVLIAISVRLVTTKDVILKMLPFDNKSEFQIVVDMPEDASLEGTARVLSELSRYIAKIPEVSDYQVYAGTASPIGFNGLVRQYYLREAPYMGDIQVNLIDHHDRKRKSHEIAASVREPLQKIGKRLGANVKIVEVPPGPPVQSPLVVEVYGIDYAGQIRVAKQIRTVFENTKDIVDVDDSIETATTKLVIHIDQSKAAQLGVSQDKVVKAINTILNGEDVGYIHDYKVKYPVPIRLNATHSAKADVETIRNLRVRSQSGELIPLSELITIKQVSGENVIYHKDLLTTSYVTGDMAGELDSPLYGMFEIYEALQNLVVEDDYLLEQYFVNQPTNPYRYGIKWDGEWQVTYETFRDMGIAYAVGMILIYLLVVAQFRSYLVPVIIMAPIPLTIIGVLPGHLFMGAQFTATSMIGMIALAGIIVRNSILLVDFINQLVEEEGIPFQDAVVHSGAVRAKPIILTGLAAMLGALFIIDDPIFSGLAVSLIFGILVSTLLTLIVIPVMYYGFMRKRFP